MTARAARSAAIAAPPVADAAAPDGEGHRARVRQRLFEGGGDALLDHELIEYLIATALPRRDTKAIAKQLIAEFGSYAGAISATPDELRGVRGMGDVAIGAIKIAQASALKLLKSGITEQPVLASWQALLDYLHADMAHSRIERVRVLHLNNKNRLIRDELMAEGSVDQAPVYVREVIKRALELGSSAIILVHNHPSGDPRPSREDIDLTRRIVEAGKPLGIGVHDHLIIGINGHASLRSLGML